MNGNERSHIFKTNWAYSQLKQLDTSISNWFKDADKYSYEVLKNTAKDNSYLLNVEANNIPIFPLSLVIGDIAHNIRCSLDHIAYELAIKNDNPDFLNNSHNSQFPIIGNESRTGNVIKGGESFSNNRSIEYVSSEACELIKNVQPYHDGENFKDHPLWILNYISNIDKHRFLHIGTAYAGSCTIKKCIINGDFTHKAILINNSISLELGNVTPIDDEDSLNELISPKMTVCFSDGLLKEKIVTKTLFEIHHYVTKNILEPLNIYLN